LRASAYVRAFLPICFEKGSSRGFGWRPREKTGTKLDREAGKLKGCRAAEVWGGFAGEGFEPSTSGL
jgi:hypothetical protein